MKQKRISIVGILLVLLLASIIVACGPAVPEGMEDEYDAIVNGEDTHSEEAADGESHDTDAEDSHSEDMEAEEADSHEDDADTAHAEESAEPEITTDTSMMPAISDRVPADLAADEYTETETGLQYYDLIKGDGASPEDGAIVEMNYAIWAENEESGNFTVIDDSFAFAEPITFIVGSQQVFPGWEEGIMSMEEGGSRQLIIPADLAFGEEGIPNAGIGPDTPIIMEVELLGIETPPTAEALTEDDYETTDSGLQIAVLAEGTGEDQAALGDTITLDFTIWVADGERYFTGSSTAGQPFTYPIGSGAVFPGWDEGVTGMTVGEKRQLIIPAAIALGSESIGEIVPANSDLLMQVELLDLVKPRKATEVDEGDFEETASGLKYYDLVEGDGEIPEEGQVVVVHYTGWLEDGTQFDSSLDRGTPFEFALGTGSVIPGWDEGVATMQVGNVRQLVIPSDLAYGDTGRPGIPPGATLIFEVELIDLK